LDLNQTLTVNGTLQLGSATETVEVTSEAPLVDTSSTQLGATVDALMATQLPLNTRDTYQLLQLHPGVMSNVGGSNSIAYGSDQPGVVSVNGGRGRSNNFNVNGGDANDLFANLPTVQPSPDSIAEFRVLTNTFDAEYGRNSGAVINVVTKSGTNQFHGNAFEFFRNSVLNAQGYFNVVKPQFSKTSSAGPSAGQSRRTAPSSSSRMRDAALSRASPALSSTCPIKISATETSVPSRAASRGRLPIRQSLTCSTIALAAWARSVYPHRFPPRVTRSRYPTPRSSPTARSPQRAWTKRPWR